MSDDEKLLVKSYLLHSGMFIMFYSVLSNIVILTSSFNIYFDSGKRLLEHVQSLLVLESQTVENQLLRRLH